MADGCCHSHATPAPSSGLVQPGSTKEAGNLCGEDPTQPPPPQSRTTEQRGKTDPLPLGNSRGGERQAKISRGRLLGSGGSPAEMAHVGGSICHFSPPDVSSHFRAGCRTTSLWPCWKIMGTTCKRSSSSSRRTRYGGEQVILPTWAPWQGLLLGLLTSQFPPPGGLQDGVRPKPVLSTCALQ